MLPLTAQVNTIPETTSSQALSARRISNIASATHLRGNWVTVLLSRTRRRAAGTGPLPRRCTSSFHFSPFAHETTGGGHGASTATVYFLFTKQLRKRLFFAGVLVGKLNKDISFALRRGTIAHVIGVGVVRGSCGASSQHDCSP